MPCETFPGRKLKERAVTYRKLTSDLPEEEKEEGGEMEVEEDEEEENRTLMDPLVRAAVAVAAAAAAVEVEVEVVAEEEIALTAATTEETAVGETDLAAEAGAKVL